MGGPPFSRHLFALIVLGLGLLSLSGVQVDPDYRKIDPAMPMSAESVEQSERIRAFSTVSRSGVPLFPAFVALRSGDPEFRGKLANLGGTSLRIADRLFVVHLPPDAARYVSRWEEVAYIEAAKLAKHLLDVSRVETSANLVQSGTGLLRPFTGSGVNVGIVDTGLDNAHLDFFNNGGTATRVAHTYAAAFFDPGISPLPLVDEEGHGTHVAGIAAGNGLSSSALYTGMAPGANLFIGKTNFRTTDIVVAVDNLMRAAAAAGTPIAVNLSLGVPTGPHDGSDAPQASLFTQSINALATTPPGGRGIVVAAAGNEQNSGEHFQALVPAFGTATAFVDDLFLVQSLPVEVDIWADGEDQYDVTVAIGAADPPPGSEAVTVPSGAAATLPSGSISVSNRRDAPLNGATHIFVAVRPPSGVTTARIDLRRTRNGGTGKIDAYTRSDVVAGTRRNHFRDAEPSGTITEPANADNVIAVGSFDTKNYDFASRTASPATQNISSFSSLGPTRDGRTKPDLTAPGLFLFSARSFEAPVANYDDLVPTDNDYAILAGTSMASPHISGIAALVWQSNPQLTGAQMRERLRRTADPVPVAGASPNTTWGHGMVNALRAVSESVASITGPSVATPGTSITLGAENSSAALGSTLTSYEWTASGGATITPSVDGTSATFSAPISGSYTVTLTVRQAAPAGTLPSTDNATVQVNTIPSASIFGPSATDNVTPVTFVGSTTDSEPGQPHTFHWILVSRPPSSAAASISVDGPQNATVVPDVAGTYEIGLRVDDGLDYSALTTASFTVGAVAVGGGGGGCSVAGPEETGNAPSAAAALVLLLLPPAVLAIGRRRLPHPGR